MKTTNLTDYTNYFVLREVFWGGDYAVQCRDATVASGLRPHCEAISHRRAVPDVTCHVPTVWGDDYAAQCRDATCGVRDNSLIARVEDAWCIEDATLFEGPCKQPRRGAPLGHKRAEQLVPRRGTLNPQPSRLVATMMRKHLWASPLWLTKI